MSTNICTSDKKRIKSKVFRLTNFFWRKSKLVVTQGQLCHSMKISDEIVQLSSVISLCVLSYKSFDLSHLVKIDEVTATEF